MKDTPPAIERKFHRMLMKRSGEERLKMGCSMHATARALATAFLSQEHPGSDPAELKRLLFLHFYSSDFKPDERKRIALALSKSAQRSEAPQARVRETVEPDKPATRARVAEPATAYRTKRPTKKRS